MSSIKGKYAIVTGAAKGIGKAIVERFLEDGAAGIAMLDYDGDLVKKTAAELDADGKVCFAIDCDVSDAAAVADACAKVYDKFGKVDILVNNAGVTRDMIFHKMTYEAFDYVMKVNMYGIFNLCHEVYPKMREQGYGKIVNLSSTSAGGNAGQANYAASKAAILGFTRTLAKECAAKNITVNSIAPGFIDTDMYAAIPAEQLAANIAKIPMKRLAAPSEVASVVAFLSSDDSSYVNGQNLTVSGAANTMIG